MTLGPGDHLGPYTIVAPLGAGGMGEVYRATDTRLGRTVAIKVLPHGVTEDPARRQRFEREARVASRLSHPHICAIFDVGEQNGRPFLVMEHLAGETLAARLARERLAIPETIGIATEIAEALDHAHRAGLVHRDVKPGNIMLTPSGAKLLDFGLARLFVVEPEPAGASTMTATDTLTSEGTILGTVPYMAPEQLEEKDTDARTDIFALGTVIYEMATGRRPFAGESRASVIAAVLSSTPAPVSAARAPAADEAGVVSLLDQVVSRCLAKDPDKRWQTAADLKHALELVEGSGVHSAPSFAPAMPRRRGAWLAAVIAVAAGATALVVYVATNLRTSVDNTRSLRYIVPPPEGSAFNRSSMFMALSPDGKKLAFVASPKQGGMALWVRTEDSLAPRQLPGTEGASQPFWSDDSRFLAFGTDQGQFKRIDVATGLTEVLTEGRINVGSWNRDGVILFRRSPDPHLLRMSSAGGPPVPATALDPSHAEITHSSPWFLPDGRRFLFLARSSDPNRDGIVYVGTLDSTERTQVCHCRSNVAYANGQLLYVRDGNLVAQRFDLERLSVQGDPVVLADQVEYNPMGGLLRAAFSVSQTGALAYRTIDETRLAWFDRRGSPLGSLGDPGNLGNPALSADERRVAVDRHDRGSTDIWLIEVASGMQSRLTNGAGATKPLWAPDGRHVVYRVAGALNMKAAAGTAPEERLTDLPPMSGPSSWTDPRAIVLDFFRPDTGGDVDEFSLDSRTSLPIVHTKHFELQGRLSPDGRWLTYVSNESGRYDVYVRPFPGGEDKWLFSPDGGSEPAWSRDGRELFYLAPDRWLMAVAVKSLGAVLERGTPVRLFETRMATLANPALTKNQYVVTSDGRFLINQPTGQAAPITVIVNWPAELSKPR
jgi:serine/threonine protein kinase